MRDMYIYNSIEIVRGNGSSSQVSVTANTCDFSPRSGSVEIRDHLAFASQSADSISCAAVSQFAGSLLLVLGVLRCARRKIVG